MRVGLLAGLVALAALGAAHAQSPVPLVSVEVAPFAEEVQPLKGQVTTTVRVRASCILAEVAGIPVSLHVASAPDWATVVVAPATQTLATSECEQGWAQTEATLIVTASDQAPAFSPAPIEVEARAGQGEREERATARVNVSASYFALLDVAAERTIVTLEPGQALDLPVMVTSYGNGPTRVELSLREAAPGLQVTVPAPVVLESRQQGGADVSEDLVVRVAAAEEDGLVNRVGVVNVEIVGAYATDDRFAGDRSQVSFLVTVRGGGLDPRAATPLAPLAALLGLAGAALVRRPLRP